MPDSFALADAPYLPEAEYELPLFIVGASLRSAVALRNVQAPCAEYPTGRHARVGIALQLHPGRAQAHNIPGVPCLVKKRAGLVRRLVGDFPQPDRVLKALGLA